MPTRGQEPKILVQLALGIFAVCMLAWPAAAQDEQLTTVILVRHAEKEADGSKDPPLTVAGQARAQALAAMLKDVPVTAIYATQFERTRATAQPLADAHGLGVMVFTVSSVEKYVDETAGLIRDKHVGDVVVVVSHSNTVPAIINALGAGPAPEMAESEYADLFIVTLSGDGATKMLHVHYGEGASK